MYAQSPDTSLAGKVTSDDADFVKFGSRGVPSFHMAEEDYRDAGVIDMIEYVALDYVGKTSGALGESSAGFDVVDALLADVGGLVSDISARFDSIRLLDELDNAAEYPARPPAVAVEDRMPSPAGLPPFQFELEVARTFVHFHGAGSAGLSTPQHALQRRSMSEPPSLGGVDVDPDKHCFVADVPLSPRSSAGLQEDIVIKEGCIVDSLSRASLGQDAAGSVPDVDHEVGVTSPCDGAVKGAKADAFDIISEPDGDDKCFEVINRFRRSAACGAQSPHVATVGWRSEEAACRSMFSFVHALLKVDSPPEEAVASLFVCYRAERRVQGAPPELIMDEASEALQISCEIIEWRNGPRLE